LFSNDVARDHPEPRPGEFARHLTDGVPIRQS